MEKVPVVCKEPIYWRAYRDRYLRDGGKSVAYDRVDKDGKVYFPVYLVDSHSLDRIRGLKLTKVIIYCCHPKQYVMGMLYAMFYENPANFEEIWD